MRNLTRKRWFTQLFCLFTLSALIYGCASVQQPMGGPRDTKPPKALKMTPKNLSTNFVSQKIIIEFDEYFNLQNEFKEVTISPEQEKPPLLKKKQKRLEIDFQEPLAKNTTYTINFGNAIIDVNESNVLKNFTYVFSTGPILDSLSITGKVKNTLTSLPQLDALVFLIPTSADSTFGKKKPAIYTRTDSSGNFKLQNLRKDTYRIYALKEQNVDKIYQQGIDDIAFLKDSITLAGNLDSVNLNLFKEVPAIFRVLDRKIMGDGTIMLTFNRPVKKPVVAITNPAALDAEKLVKFSKTADTARIWLNNMDFDSVRIAVSDDRALLQSININKGKKDNYVRNLLATDNLENGGLLNPSATLKLTFPVPVTEVDVKKITLLEDSIPITTFSVEKDSTSFLSYFFKYRWKQKTKYEIRFAEGAFTGILNSKNKYFSKKVELIPADNYSTIEFKVTVAEKKPLILEFIAENKNLVARYTFSNDTTIKLNNLKAGKYFARVIYDNNNNGIWDSGSLSKLLQPENIWYDPRGFSVRANWEVKDKLEVPKEY